MDTPRFLPAERVRAGNVGGGYLLLQSIDGQEVGTLLGFVIEPGSPRIRSLVVESAGGAREVPLEPVQFDPLSGSLRLMASTADADLRGVAFALGSLPLVADEDLWVPIFHTAA